jgi:hypothetical protein
MPARDLFHEAVKNALVKAGWTITHDPLHLKWEGKDLYVDLGAERLIAAELGSRKIAVEVKSFLGDSETDDLQGAFGPYMLYRTVLGRIEPEREIYLAVPEQVVGQVFRHSLGALVREEYQVRVIGFDPRREEIVEWMD